MATGRHGDRLRAATGRVGQDGDAVDPKVEPTGIGGRGADLGHGEAGGRVRAVRHDRTGEQGGQEESGQQDRGLPETQEPTGTPTRSGATGQDRAQAQCVARTGHGEPSSSGTSAPKAR